MRLLVRWLTRLLLMTDVDELTKIVSLTYTFHNEGDSIFPWDDYSYPVKSLLMFVLSQDRNTGYSISHNVGYDNPTQQWEQHPPAVQEVFNSFELVN